MDALTNKANSFFQVIILTHQEIPSMPPPIRDVSVSLLRQLTACYLLELAQNSI